MSPWELVSHAVGDDLGPRQCDSGFVLSHILVKIWDLLVVTLTLFDGARRYSRSQRWPSEQHDRCCLGK